MSTTAEPVGDMDVGDLFRKLVAAYDAVERSSHPAMPRERKNLRAVADELERRGYNITADAVGNLYLKNGGEVVRRREVSDR